MTAVMRGISNPCMIPNLEQVAGLLAGSGILNTPDLADVLDLGGTSRREAGLLPPKALAFIRGEEPDVGSKSGKRYAFYRKVSA